MNQCLVRAISNIASPSTWRWQRNQRKRGRKELASRTFLSENTIKKHLNGIFKKTGTTSFGSLAQLLVRGQPVIPREEIRSGLG